MIVYVASQYTIGDKIANVRRQIDAGEALSAKGHTPILPLLSHYWHERHPHDWSFWIRRCMELITVADAVVRLPGQSAGADAEVREARHLGIPVYFSVADVPDEGNNFRC